LDLKEESNEAFEIPFAERKYLKETSSRFNKKIFLTIPIFLLLLFIIELRLNRNSKLSPTGNINIQNTNGDERSILGHLPYNEVSKEKLVVIEPNIEVHIDMSKSLLEMREQAKNDGISLVFLSGYRSINLQEEIFYSLKSIRNQVATERARVSAPPGYSEHSTGFAIDIGDFNKRETDFEVEFENTEAFRWLKNNAAKYHFKLSFDKNNVNVDYEPWHWRYEGSIEALKVFEASNRKLINTKY
tara:strand:- start:73 stop:804 length:732 start_codon:yes stop_codon:yes gene_type:complete